LPLPASPNGEEKKHGAWGMGHGAIDSLSPPLSADRQAFGGLSAEAEGRGGDSGGQITAIQGGK